MNPLYGKYKGIVKDNHDPLQLGRVRAEVVDVYGKETSGWARPCFPFAGKGLGFFALPAVGAWVWIEFERGDPDFPIWSGCFWENTADVPPALLAPPYKKVLLQTQGGNSVVLDDSPGVGGITLTTASGEKLSLSAQGITLTTKAGDKLSLSPQGATLQTAAGQKVTLGPPGVEITNGTGAAIKLAGPQVSLNNGALEVL